jgi:hypothetical protein
MIKWVIDECRWRAFLFKKLGLTLVFDAIIKSDAVISSQVHDKLKVLALPLEETRVMGQSFNSQKIVDPARHPLAYGVTRVIQNEVINMDHCLKSIGRGVPLSLHEADPLAAPEEINQRAKTTPEFTGPTQPPPRVDPWGSPPELPPYRWCDEKFQLIPCDLSLHQDRWRITSYVNDLHPAHHRELYTVIEEIINQCVQPWNECLAHWTARWNRIPLRRVVFRPPLRNVVVPEGLFDDTALEWIAWKVDRWRKRRSIKLPEPAEFHSSKFPQPNLDLVQQFGPTGIQVLVQLEIVSLNPAKVGAKSQLVIKNDWHLQGHMVCLVGLPSAWPLATLTPIERAYLCNCRLLLRSREC